MYILPESTLLPTYGRCSEVWGRLPHVQLANPWPLQNMSSALHASVEQKKGTLAKSHFCCIAPTRDLYVQWDGRDFFQLMQNFLGKKKWRTCWEVSERVWNFLFLHLLTFDFSQRSEISYWSCIVNSPSGCTQLSEGFPLMSQTSEDVVHV